MSSLYQKKDNGSYKRMYGYKQSCLIIDCLPRQKSRRGYEWFDMLQRRFIEASANFQLNLNTNKSVSSRVQAK